MHKCYNGVAAGCCLLVFTVQEKRVQSVWAPDLIFLPLQLKMLSLPFPDLHISRL